MVVVSIKYLMPLNYTLKNGYDGKFQYVHLPDSSVHGILQARILVWVAISFSRGSFWRRDQTQVSCTAVRFFTIWAAREAPLPPPPPPIKIYMQITVCGVVLERFQRREVGGCLDINK